MMIYCQQEEVNQPAKNKSSIINTQQKQKSYCWEIVGKTVVKKASFCIVVTRWFS